MKRLPYFLIPSNSHLLEAFTILKYEIVVLRNDKNTIKAQATVYLCHYKTINCMPMECFLLNFLNKKFCGLRR